MHTNPILLLFLLLLFTFSPTLLEWAVQGGSDWYRPYLLWLCAIIIAAWAEWRRSRHGL